MRTDLQLRIFVQRVNYNGIKLNTIQNTKIFSNEALMTKNLAQPS